MKTTIDLPDELASAAKRLAHDQHVSLRELVVAGLRSEVERRREAPAADFHFPSFAGHGLVADLDPTEVLERSYGLS